jgi:hypothetical protein
MRGRRIPERVRIPLLRASRQVESALGYFRLRDGRSDLAEEVIADLKTEGVHVTSVERLLGESAPAFREAMARASAFIRECEGREHEAWQARGASTDLVPHELLARLPEFFLVGLNARLLSVVEHYLRVPVAYHGAVLRHSLVDGHQTGPRLWHRDCEDFNVLRAVFYVSDVTEDSGPFEYIPRHYSEVKGSANWQMRTNDEMRTLVPESQWKRCVGPAGTVVLADSARVFHHESVQRGRDRAVIMIGYSSRRPSGRPLALSHFPVESNVATLSQLVAPDRHPHVLGWRGLTPTVSPEYGASPTMGDARPSGQ